MNIQAELGFLKRNILTRTSDLNFSDNFECVSFV
jgi:hypothetical protein